MALIWTLVVLGRLPRETDAVMSSTDPGNHDNVTKAVMKPKLIICHKWDLGSNKTGQNPLPHEIKAIVYCGLLQNPTQRGKAHYFVIQRESAGAGSSADCQQGCSIYLKFAFCFPRLLSCGNILLSRLDVSLSTAPSPDYLVQTWEMVVFSGKWYFLSTPSATLSKLCVFVSSLLLQSVCNEKLGILSIVNVLSLIEQRFLCLLPFQ